MQEGGAHPRWLAGAAREDLENLAEDDIYGDLHFGPERPRPCKAFDTRGQVMPSPRWGSRGPC
ncbi:hypothetical protein D7W79_05230 [Corallococcus exercitus]|nr:hypothetical protein D7W79_05230 [Corallococcus exercitus]